MALIAKDTVDRVKEAADIAEVIRALGPASCILSSDLGQPGNALPADGFGEFLVALRGQGFSEQ